MFFSFLHRIVGDDFDEYMIIPYTVVAALVGVWVIGRPASTHTRPRRVRDGVSVFH